jgi:hypothetical protein
MTKNVNLIFRILTWVFLAGVVAQVLLAGLVVVARWTDWQTHIGLGHTLGLPLLFMLITVYVGKADRQVKRTMWILFAVWFLQAEVLIFLRFQDPPLLYLSALHPVLALIDFWLGMRLLSLTKVAA